MASEVLLGSGEYCAGTGAVDVWAAGCVFAEMLRGVPLFQTTQNTRLGTLSPCTAKSFCTGTDSFHIGWELFELQDVTLWSAHGFYARQAIIA